MTKITALLVCLLPLLVRSAPVSVDGYAAVVSTNVITASEVMSYIQAEKDRLAASLQGEELATKLQTLYDDGLERLIDKQLILEQYRAQGGQLPDHAVDDRINDVINRRFKGDYGEFQKALFANGQTLEDFRAEIKEDLIVSLMRRQEVSETVRVPMEDIVKLYQARTGQYTIREQVNLQIIQFKPAPDPAYQATKEENLRKLHAKLKAGEEEFAAAAKQYSEGFNAEQGGVMGWKDTTDIRAEILEAVKGLPEGRIGDPLKLGDDTFLVKVLGRRPAGLRPLEDVMPEIESELFEARAREAYKAWLLRLRHKFPVTVY